MATKLLEEARKLSPAARIKLVGEIWDSLVDNEVPPTLSKGQQAELDRRLERISRTGSTGSEWSVVNRRVINSNKPLGYSK